MTEPDPRSGPSDATADAVLTCVFNLLVSEGIAAITPSRIHQETGVARTTIYKHWPTTSDMIAQIVAHATRSGDDPPPVGDVEADLTAALSRLAWRLRERPVRPLLAALMDSEKTAERPTVSADDYVAGLFASTRAAIEQAIDRGEIVPRPVDDLVAELAGPALTEHLFMASHPTEDDLADRVAAFLRAHRARE